MKRKAYEPDPLIIADRVGMRVQELVSAVAKDLCDFSKPGSATSPSSVVFFPEGIQLIYVKLSLGPEATPIVSLELEISGQKSTSARNIKSAEGLKIISHSDK